MKKLLLAMVLVIAAVSCGGDDETMADKTEKYAKVFCDKVFTCDGAEMYQATFSGTKDNCIKFFTETDSEDSEEDECENPNFDKADQCIKCYEDLSCEDFVSKENPCPICEDTCDDE